MNKDNNYPILKYETDAEVLNNRTYTDIYYRLMLIKTYDNRNDPLTFRAIDFFGGYIIFPYKTNCCG